MPMQYKQVHYEEDLSTVCRLCVTHVDPSDLSHIFSGALGSLEMRIAQVLQIHVRCGDGLPDAVCSACIKNLNDTFHFFAESAATDDFLRKVVAFILEESRADNSVMSVNDKILMISKAIIGNDEMSSLCRLCGTKHNSSLMTAIFGDGKNSFERPIRSMLHLVVSKGDGLPDSLCSKCVDKLNAARHFIAEVVSGDNLLRNVIYKGTEIEELAKQEPKLEPDDLAWKQTLEMDNADSSDMVYPLLVPRKDEKPTEPLTLLLQYEKDTESQAWLQQDEKDTESQACLQQDEKDTESQAWLQQDEKATESQAWLQQDEKATESQAWLQQDEKDTESQAWLQQDEKPTESQALLQQDEKPTESQAWHQQDEKPTESQAWLQQDEKATESQTWLQQDEKSTESQAWLQQDEKAIESQAWPQQDEKSTESQALLQQDEKASESQAWLQQDKKAIESHALLQQDEKATESQALLQQDEKDTESQAWLQQDEKATESQALLQQDEKPTESQALLQQDEKDTESHAWLQQDEKATESQAWLQQHEKDTESQAWLQQDEKDTESKALLQQDVKDTESHALLQQDEKDTESQAWLQQDEKDTETKALLQQDEKDTESQAWLQQDEKVTESHALLQQDEKDTESQAWLQQDEMDTESQALLQQDEKDTESLALLQQDEEDTESQAWLQQDEKDTGLQPACVPSVPFAAKPFKCAPCATEFPTETAMITHFCNKICKNILERNQPFVKLVRLEETLFRSTQRLSSLMQVNKKKKPFIVAESQAQEVEKPAKLQPFSAELFKCAFCATECSTETAPIPHFCSRICRKSVELNQPVLELVRLEATSTFSTRRLCPQMQVRVGKQSFSCGIPTQKSTLTKQIRKYCGPLMTINACDFYKKQYCKKDDVTNTQVYTEEMPYSCKFCSQTFSRLDHLINHTNEHAVTNLSHICEVCKKVFSSKFDLKIHSQLHIGVRSNSCTVHPQAFNRQKNLTEHSVTKTGTTCACGICKKRYHIGTHSASRTMYACPVCFKTFFRHCHLVRHSVSQNGIRVACDMCKKQFNCKERLVLHMRTYSGERRYACTVCSKACTERWGRTRHLVTHTGITFTCDICKKQFKRKDHLASHIRMHTLEKQYSCPICSKTFAHRSGLDNHAATHTGTTFACQICKKQFTRKDSVAAHMRSHTGKRPFSCTVCSKAFTWGSLLKQHMWTHSRERQYSYTVCSKAFVHRSGLYKHSVTHTGTIFACRICKKEFSRKQAVVLHMRTHTGERPFSCAVCSKAFSDRSNLVRHSVIHTVKKPLHVNDVRSSSKDRKSLVLHMQTPPGDML